MNCELTLVSYVELIQMATETSKRKNRKNLTVYVLKRFVDAFEDFKNNKVLLVKKK